MSSSEKEQPAPANASRVDPMTGMPMAVSQTSNATDADPDAQGLPPHVVLPEPYAFKRDQLRARLVVSLAALAVLGVMVLLSDDYRQMYALCAGGAALAVLVLGVRYVIARQKAAAAADAASKRTERPASRDLKIE